MSTGSSMDKNDVSRLTMAAEELMKAASSHVETTSLAIGQETVQELKKISKGSSSLDSKVDTLNETLSTFKTEMNSDFGALMKLYLSIHASIDELKKNAAFQTKFQRLDWAFDHAELHSFDYYEKSENNHYHHNYHNNRKSTEVVKLIVMSFRQGVGRYVTNFYKRTTGVDDDHLAFRSAISDQILSLLGTKPRLEQSGDKWAIYYS